jgi:putative endonuclease
MARRRFYVNILASRSRTLYVGVTNDLERRIYEHRHRRVDGFSSRYRIGRPVHFEETDDAMAALQREKQIKGWLRSKKVALIESVNPTWEDLSDGWVEEEREADPPRSIPSRKDTGTT